MHFGEETRKVVTIWLFTLLLFAGAFATYFTVYVENRRSYFTEQRLRMLGNIGDRFTNRVENIANNVFPNAIKASADHKNTDLPQCDQAPQTSTDLSIQLNPGVHVSDSSAACDFQRIEYLTNLVPKFTLERSIAYRRRDPQINSSRLDVESRDSSLLFSFRGPFENQSQHYVIELRGYIRGIELLGQYDTDSFDQLLVSDENGRVLFRTGTHPMYITRIDEMLGTSHSSQKQKEQDDSQAEWLTASAVSDARPVVIGGRCTSPS